MFKINHEFKTPDSFKPPFKAHVKETYWGSGQFLSAREGLLKIKNTLPWTIKSLLQIRNNIVEKFGFKTDFDLDKEFGPFEVEFTSKDEAIIRYEEENFVFYGEILTQTEELRGYFAVKFKSLKGRIYFYTIFPGHYLIFKYLINNMRKA